MNGTDDTGNGNCLSPGFKPYVPAGMSMKEFTVRAVITGAVLGIIFGASSLYLVLKVGITVSASIPIAVLSITLFRVMSPILGRATILENNIVQTTGSAGESIAFGVGVTMPAVMLLGFDMDLTRVMLVSLLGGILGILMMIPLRRAFIVRLHGKAGEPGKLQYPEGTACAEVLISGDKGGGGGGFVFFGFGIALAHHFISEGMNVLRTNVSHTLGFFNRAAELSCDMAVELLGVGYIIGLKTAATMMAGAVLGYLVIAPAISIFGDGMQGVLPPGIKPIAQMSLGEIRTNYLLYVGAGCVATAGIISMLRTMPLIVRSVLSGIRSARATRHDGSNAGGADAGGGVMRTDRDMPMSVVFLGSLALIGLLALYLSRDVSWQASLAGGALVVVFGFLFVMVSSRLTGEIGSSSNPISGMTIATLALTCLIFLALGWTSPKDRLLAICVGGIVCIAASNGGTTSQDLKTGFLVGATPRLQQWAILIGAMTSALMIGVTLLLFNQAGVVISSKPDNLPTVNVQEAAPNLTETMEHDGQTYRVWRVVQGESATVPPGKYLVDDNGDVKWLVDPGITGRLTEEDDGRDVNMKFEAPKTQVMGIIINGVLGQRLNWGLVLMGAMIAVTLELCGISALPFAVGVYVPMSASAPIFLGGILRWLTDSWQKRRRRREIEIVEKAESPDTSLESETSPGVLLASGFIAGGTLAGVIVAFLNLAPTWLEKINVAGIVERTAWLASTWTTIAAFGFLMLLLLIFGLRRSTATPTAGTSPTATDVPDSNGPHVN